MKNGAIHHDLVYFALVSFSVLKHVSRDTLLI